MPEPHLSLRRRFPTLRSAHPTQQPALRAALLALALVLPVAGHAQGTAPHPGEAQAAQAGCTRCHAVDRRRTGPAFVDVAARWRDRPEARSELSARLRAGRGHPVVRVPEPTLDSILDWVLTR